MTSTACNSCQTLTANRRALVDIFGKCKKENHRLLAPRTHASVCACQLDAKNSIHVIKNLIECGNIDDAQEIFDGMDYRDEWSWNTLINSYVKCGQLQLAFLMHQKMEEEGSIYTLEHTYTALLIACSKSKNLKEGLKLHAELDRRGFLNGNVFLGSALIDMYAKCGINTRAETVFHSMSQRNVVSWTTLIAMYVENGRSEEALTCLECMQSQAVLPNSVTLMCGLKACGTLQLLEEGQKLHIKLERQECYGDHAVGNTLVDMYAKCSSFILAKQVFDRLPVRDVVSWTALIAGYVQHDNAEQALRCFEQMQLEGVSPNSVTLACSLKACGNLGAIEQGREIHAEIERQLILQRERVVGNALVSMYAKCGFFHFAQQVLDQLPCRDVMSWTALISGLVDHEYGEKALEYCEQMQLEGEAPNTVTLLCALNACGLAGAAKEGMEIHCEIERRMLIEDDTVSKVLLEMYAKLGLLFIATRVFDNLKVQSLMLWNTMMEAFLENGHEEEVLHCYDILQHDGVVVDAFSYVCCLKACSCLGDVKMGQDIHCEIERQCLLRGDLVLGNTLVDMYAKFGFLTLAEEVFDGLLTRNVVSWTALISGYAEHGQGKKACMCFDLMQVRGVYPNVATFVCVLKACGSIQAGDKGREIHVEVERLGLIEQSLIVGNALVDMYAKCGLLAIAQEVFDKLPAHDVISWTALVTGYSEYGLGEKALKCFKKMQLDVTTSDAVALICGLKACGMAKAADEGQALHEIIKEQGLLNEDLLVGSTLIDMYAKCSSLSLAENVFASLSFRDQVSWNALIGGYIEHGKSEDVLRCFKQMRQEAVLPDADTFVHSLKACAITSALLEGQTLHAEIKSTRLSEQDVFIGSSLVAMYARCGSFTLAKLVFERLIDQNVVSWTALIAGYEEHGLSEEALKCFDAMQLKCPFANDVTYISVLKACGSVGAIDKGIDIHAEIERQTLLKGDVVVGNALIDMYVKCGSILRAQEVFDSILDRNVVSWTTLLMGYAQLGEIHVLEILDRMIEEDVEPNSVTFAIILSACNRAGLVGESYMFLRAMKSRYGLLPTIEHFTWVIDVHCRAGKLEKALAIIYDMPFCPDPLIWHTLLVACEKWGLVKLGREAFKSAMWLDESDAEAFVLMSHIYASCGFLEQANRFGAMSCTEMHEDNLEIQQSQISFG